MKLLKFLLTKNLWFQENEKWKASGRNLIPALVIGSSTLLTYLFSYEKQCTFRFKWLRKFEKSKKNKIYPNKHSFLWHTRKQKTQCDILEKDLYIYDFHKKMTN